MTLLCVDPGFDDLGWASFDLPPVQVALLNHVGPLLRAKGTIRTSPGYPDAERLMLLAARLEAVIVEQGTSVAAVERAATFAGTYRQHRDRQRGKVAINAGSLEKLNWTVGLCAAVAASHSARVLLLAPATTPEPSRNLRVYMLWPEFQGGKSNEHERDALYHGIVLLTDSRRRWAA